MSKNANPFAPAPEAKDDKEKASAVANSAAPGQVSPDVAAAERAAAEAEQRIRDEQAAAHQAAAEAIAAAERAMAEAAEKASEPERVSVFVPQAFRILRPDGQTEEIPQGPFSMLASDLEHWHVKAMGVKPTPT